MNAAARRSCLVVPGNEARMQAKALSSGADEVVFDLEDAVAADVKAAARGQVAATLAEPEWSERTVAVRINAIDSGEQGDDLAMCAELALQTLTLVVPKVESVADLVPAARVAPLQALIETPEGLANAAEIARSRAVVALILGYADLAAALGRRDQKADPAIWLVAQETLLAAARRTDAQAIDGPYFSLRDLRGLAAAARHTRELGFDGKWAIHPAQVPLLNATFGASPEEREWAQRVTRAVNTAGETGAGAVALQGRMVDAAMARQARRLLALPEAPALRDEPSPIHRVSAPYFEDVETGTKFHAPAVTLTEGHASLHQAIVGDRLRLSLDADLYEAVTGARGLLAHPMLVCDMAIGQSTAPSARVLGNLFYRGLGARPVPLGTTLRTTTTVVARRPASGGRGIVALRVSTVDARGTPVLEFWRAPLLPIHDASDGGTGDDLSQIGEPVDVAGLIPTGWDLAPLRETRLGPLSADLRRGDDYLIEAAETVTAAPELARMSLNLAHAHTDAGASSHGERLVYGGHVIGIAAAHVTRALPDLATILAWESCEHVGPTFEGDRLRSRVRITGLETSGLVHLEVRTGASSNGEPPRQVLVWALVGLMP
jgi:citrate lyase beta subunit/acyl dehydratase